MAWHRGIPSTHGRVRNQIGGFQWYWHRWISSLAVRICRYRWSNSHLRALQAVQHLGLYILVHGLDVVALPAVAEDGPVKLAASVLPVEQAGRLDGAIVPAHEQHRGVRGSTIISQGVPSRFSMAHRLSGRDAITGALPGSAKIPFICKILPDMISSKVMGLVNSITLWARPCYQHGRAHFLLMSSASSSAFPSTKLSISGNQSGVNSEMYLLA